MVFFLPYSQNFCPLWGVTVPHGCNVPGPFLSHTIHYSGVTHSTHSTEFKKKISILITPEYPSLAQMAWVSNGNPTPQHLSPSRCHIGTSNSTSKMNLITFPPMYFFLC